MSSFWQKQAAALWSNLTGALASADVDDDSSSCSTSDPVEELQPHALEALRLTAAERANRQRQTVAAKQSSTVSLRNDSSIKRSQLATQKGVSYAQCREFRKQRCRDGKDISDIWCNNSRLMNEYSNVTEDLRAQVARAAEGHTEPEWQGMVHELDMHSLVLQPQIAAATARANKLALEAYIYDQWVSMSDSEVQRSRLQEEQSKARADAGRAALERAEADCAQQKSQHAKGLTAQFRTQQHILCASSAQKQLETHQQKVSSAAVTGLMWSFTLARSAGVEAAAARVEDLRVQVVDLEALLASQTALAAAPAVPPASASSSHAPAPPPALANSAAIPAPAATVQLVAPPATPQPTQAIPTAVPSASDAAGVAPGPSAATTDRNAGKKQGRNPASNLLRWPVRQLLRFGRKAVSVLPLGQ